METENEDIHGQNDRNKSMETEKEDIHGQNDVVKSDKVM